MSDWQEIVDSEFPQDWRFDGDNPDGVVIEGILIEKKSDVGANHSWVYVIERAGGEQRSIWGAKVLDDKMTKVDINDEVRITFTGVVTPQEPGKRPYKTFKVERRKSPFSEI